MRVSNKNGAAIAFGERQGRISVPQNLSAREIERRLIALPVAPESDITLLTAHNRIGSQFETAFEAQVRRDREFARIEALTCLEPIADRLSCDKRSPCGEAFCATCGRLFRRWFIGQTLRIARDHDLQVLTVALEVIPPLALLSCDIPSLKRRTAQRIRRAAPSAQLVVGGIEAEYQSHENVFLVHAHLLISRLPDKEMKALRSAFSDIDVTRPVKLQELKDAPRQVSYLLKFVTYHRPVPQNGSRRSLAMPLPNHAFAQLALWRSRYGFFDFIFMKGIRRKGGDLVQIEKEKGATRMRRLRRLRRLRPSRRD